MSSDELWSTYQKWLQKLRKATTDVCGEAMCEGTRMVIGIAAIIYASSPKEWTKERGREAHEAFKAAQAALEAEIKTGSIPKDETQRYNWFLENVSSRLGNLEDAMSSKWCPGWRDVA